MEPSSKQQAPDPSNSYERAHPENEAGMGRLDNDVATPRQSPDRQDAAVQNKQKPEGQINAEDVENERAGRDLANGGAAPDQPDHSMKDEEPLGWDQAPTDIHDPERQRHPRTEGKGGTK